MSVASDPIQWLNLPLASDDAPAPLGHPTGWVRIADHGHDDALFFSSAPLLKDFLPRITLDRFDAASVHAGRWPDPTVSRDDWLLVALEPYADGHHRGWTVLRYSSQSGVGIVERSWLFSDTFGLDLVRARYSIALHDQMEELLETVTSSATGLRSGGTVQIADLGVSGPSPLPHSGQITAAGWEWLCAFVIRKAVSHIEEKDRAALEAAGLTSGRVPTERGHALALLHDRAPRRTLVGVHREGGRYTELDLRMDERLTTWLERQDDRIWVHASSKNTALESLLRFTGVGPGSNRRLPSSEVSAEVLRRRLADRQVPVPAELLTEARDLWEDTWFRWVLSSTADGETDQPRQFIGTLAHGHFSVGTVEGASPGTVRMTPVPSTELFSLLRSTTV